MWERTGRSIEYGRLTGPTSLNVFNAVSPPPVCASAPRRVFWTVSSSERCSGIAKTLLARRVLRSGHPSVPSRRAPKSERRYRRYRDQKGFCDTGCRYRVSDGPPKPFLHEQEGCRGYRVKDGQATVPTNPFCKNTLLAKKGVVETALKTVSLMHLVIASHAKSRVLVLQLRAHAPVSPALQAMSEAFSLRRPSLQPARSI